MIKSPAARLLLISLGFIAFVGTLLPGAYGGFYADKMTQFKKIDTNRDKIISWEEFHDEYWRVSKAKFDEFTNGDKKLDLLEFFALPHDYLPPMTLNFDYYRSTIPSTSRAPKIHSTVQSLIGSYCGNDPPPNSPKYANYRNSGRSP